MVRRGRPCRTPNHDRKTQATNQSEQECSKKKQDLENLEDCEGEAKEMENGIITTIHEQATAINEGKLYEEAIGDLDLE
ncbi:unnamed protein product [Cuscuta campestris]|uniref:Uncharacterized protein n=1 Tax=Cuscuta campestris TaxID=132261 RepID=A0A484N5M4_9ASTE|nr:unnamed protein product [Cuscuta campestris]